MTLHKQRYFKKKDCATKETKNKGKNNQKNQTAGD
jgi:hypothetical protein